MRIGIGNDPAAYELKIHLIAHLQDAGPEVTDFGHYDTTSAGYPAHGCTVSQTVVAANGAS